MKKLVTATALAMCLCAFADKTYTEKAPDGVNTITTTVDDKGYVTSRQMTCAHVQEQYAPANTQETEDAAIRGAIDQAMAKMDDAHRNRIENEEIVKTVYGEGTNSSFITRAELTDTQKRFIALGRRYTQMTFALLAMQQRLQLLEKYVSDQQAKTLNNPDVYPPINPVWLNAVSNLEDRVDRLEGDASARKERIAKAKASRASRKTSAEKTAEDKVQRAIERSKAFNKSNRKEVK